MERVVRVVHDDTPYSLVYYPAVDGEEDQLSLEGDGCETIIIGTQGVDEDEMMSDETTDTLRKKLSYIYTNTTFEYDELLRAFMNELLIRLVDGRPLASEYYIRDYDVWIPGGKEGSLHATHDMSTFLDRLNE
jgi:hypothetical protein